MIKILYSMMKLNNSSLNQLDGETNLKYFPARGSRQAENARRFLETLKCSLKYGRRMFEPHIFKIITSRRPLIRLPGKKFEFHPAAPTMATQYQL